MRLLALFRRELQVGPRSPLLLYAIVLPVLMTLLVRGVFGTLFQSQPRLGVVDEGNSIITAQVQQLDGIEVTVLDSVEELKRMVEANDLDAGLVLQPGFDTDVKTGTMPELHLFISGESLASNRIILEVTALDLIRGIAGAPAPVDVQVISLGEQGHDLVIRLLPLVMIYAVIIGGSFIPAMSIVQERENRTLEAVMATPARMTEVLAAKGLFGFVLAIATGMFTLFLNSAWGGHPGAMLAALAVAGVMVAEIGLILGSVSKDSNVLFTLFKSAGILLIFPVIFPIFPSLPQWIAHLGPTFYFLDPIFKIAVEGARFGDVWGTLAIGVAICVALVPIVKVLGHRLEERLAVSA
ncbi:MAG: ABC transporter permease [Gammaproteobacteria bacterium]|nr:ABC transporter permease [Gammaproteobacteria bacterium]